MENNNPLLTRVFPTNPVLVESGNPFCNPGKLTALGQVGISTLVLNGKPVTNDNQS